MPTTVWMVEERLQKFKGILCRVKFIRGRKRENQLNYELKLIYTSALSFISQE